MNVLPDNTLLDTTAPPTDSDSILLSSCELKSFINDTNYRKIEIVQPVSEGCERTLANNHQHRIGGGVMLCTADQPSRPASQPPKSHC